MDFGVRELEIGDAALDKLWGHSVREHEVWQIFYEHPVLMWQEPSEEERDDGSWRIRPRRILMIGRTRSRRLLTIVLELPDEEGVAEVVTGFDAKGNEPAWYRQRGGR